MDIIPIKKVFRIIDSCINLEQLDSCKNIAESYTNLISRKNVVNYEKVREVLYIKINERKEEINLAFNFKSKQKIKSLV